MSRGRGLRDGGGSGEVGLERAPGWGGRDLGRGSRVDLCVFFPTFSTNSHLLGENKVNRNPPLLFLAGLKIVLSNEILRNFPLNKMT